MLGFLSTRQPQRPSRDEVADAATAVARARLHLRYHQAERRGTAEFAGLDKLRLYLLGLQRHPSVPEGSRHEVRQLAAISRVNVLDLIISSTAQALYVDGYRSPRANADAAAWSHWQRNGMDRRQRGIHRAGLAYGTSYVTVLPSRSGPELPVIRGHSPRRMHALYGDDDLWPLSALQVTPSGSEWMLRLYMPEAVHELVAKDIDDVEGATIQQIEAWPHRAHDEHGAPVVPVVRYLNVDDLDEDHLGEVDRLIPVQDQIDESTFGLLVAQRFGAFRQRWILGWTADSEEDRLKVSASRFLTLSDHPEDVKVGEFEQTELAGYIESRRESLKHAATLSQTPAHELIGELVNLSAEALVAAEAGQRRKVTDRQLGFGESHEQVLALATAISGVEADPEAQVRWRDTESRALSATVDALGKMASLLGIPPQELWERIPGVSQQDVERWQRAFEASDSLAGLQALLDRQAA